MAVPADKTSSSQTLRELEGVVDAIHRSQAVIEFEPDGTIRTANGNFLDATGYALAEVVGKHHRMFCDPAEAASPAYADFWTRLGAGEFEGGEYKRFRKDGSALYLQATYNPILDTDGSVLKVVKFASDITEQTLTKADQLGKVAAISRSQAVRQSDPNGRT